MFRRVHLILNASFAVSLTISCTPSGEQISYHTNETETLGKPEPFPQSTDTPEDTVGSTPEEITASIETSDGTTSVTIPNSGTGSTVININIPPAGEKETTTPSTGAPSLPSGIVIPSSPTINRTPVISWTAPSEGPIETYHLKACSTSACKCSGGIDVDGAATSATLPQLEYGTHYICVNAVYAAGHSSAFASSTALTVIPITPTRIVFLTEPTGPAWAGNSLPTSPVVALQDDDGNTAVDSSDSITMSLSTNPSSGVLSGTTTVNAVNGVATFSDLSIDKGGHGYTLSASSDSLGGTSSPFEVFGEFDWIGSLSATELTSNWSSDDSIDSTGHKSFNNINGVAIDYTNDLMYILASDAYHIAIRLLLPLLPSLAASSPFVEGKRGPLLDTRLNFYLANQRRIPSIMGDGIPEPIRNESEYREKILAKMYKDISPQDPDGLLQHEWLNSRAAIPRFDRDAIEIRILDSQESLRANFELINIVVACIKTLTSSSHDLEDQLKVPQETLIQNLKGILSEQGHHKLTDESYLRALKAQSGTVKEIIAKLAPDFSESPLLKENLAERLVKHCGDAIDREVLLREYMRLAETLKENQYYL